MPALETFSASNTGLDLIETPNPNESAVAVTVDLVNPTPAMLPVLGEALSLCRMPVKNPALIKPWGVYTFTHKRRHLPGTLTLYYAFPKTARQRVTPFNSYEIKDQSDWAAIVNGFVWYQNSSLPLSATNSDGTTANKPRILGKPDYVPPFSGPGVYIVNEYLSEVPFPDSLADADNAPVLTNPRWDWVEQEGDFGPCYHPRLEVPVPDPQNWQEIARTGEPSGADISASSQVFKATNHRTWQEYQWKFDVSRTDGDMGQYYARELIKVPPSLKGRIRP